MEEHNQRDSRGDLATWAQNMKLTLIGATMQYENAPAVILNQYTSPYDFKIRQLLFKDMTIVGPAVVLLIDSVLDKCVIELSDRKDFEEVIWQEDSRDRVWGLTVLENCRFENCRFVGIGFCGDKQFCNWLRDRYAIGQEFQQ